MAHKPTRFRLKDGRNKLAFKADAHQFVEEFQEVMQQHQEFSIARYQLGLLGDLNCFTELDKADRQVEKLGTALDKRIKAFLEKWG